MTADSTVIWLAQTAGWAWVKEGEGVSGVSGGELTRSFDEHVGTRLGVDPSAIASLELPAQVEGPTGSARIVLDQGARLCLFEQARELSAFASSASHELSNALSAILGWAQLGQDDEDQASNALSTISAAALAAQEITADMLGTPTRASGSPCDASAVCTNVARFLYPLASKRGVRVVVDAPAGSWTLADRAAVFRIAWNLALNSVQVVPSGGTVSLRVGMDDDQVNLTVTDDGPGMDSKTAAHAFDRGFSRRSGGSGIGLNTVQTTVRSMGGSLTLDSEAGAGARFVITLPASEAPLERTTTHRPSGMQGGPLPARILVVEDDPGIRELIETTMGLRGVEVVCVENAKSALAMEGTFDIGLIDLSLPDGRGDVLLQHLASRGSVGRTILMSGHANPGELVAQPDFWLPKPFDVRELTASLRAVMAQGSVAQVS